MKSPFSDGKRIQSTKTHFLIPNGSWLYVEEDLLYRKDVNVTVIGEDILNIYIYFFNTFYLFAEGEVSYPMKLLVTDNRSSSNQSFEGLYLQIPGILNNGRPVWENVVFPLYFQFGM